MFIPADQPSTYVFTVATRHNTPGSRILMLHHPMHIPLRTVDTSPGLADQSLISGEKISKAGYVSIFNNKEFSIYNGRTTKILLSEEDILNLKS